jgi:hypothetical protein
VVLTAIIFRIQTEKLSDGVYDDDDPRFGPALVSVAEHLKCMTEIGAPVLDTASAAVDALDEIHCQSLGGAYWDSRTAGHLLDLKAGLAVEQSLFANSPTIHETVLPLLVDPSIHEHRKSLKNAADRLIAAYPVADRPDFPSRPWGKVLLPLALLLS